MGGASAKRKGTTYPQLPTPPAPFDDVANLGDPPAIGVGDAAVVGAAITIAEEAVAGALEERALLAIGVAKRRDVIARHLPVERGEAVAAAHRDFTRRPRTGAVEARPGGGGHRGGLG